MSTTGMSVEDYSGHKTKQAFYLASSLDFYDAIDEAVEQFEN